MKKKLRRKIVEMITKAGEGHIPSSFSIVDIIYHLYHRHLQFDAKNPDAPERDRFILSKGHGGAALFVVLEEFGFISQKDLESYGEFEGVLGGHPDRTKVPGVEASTGSLGHGFPFAVGVALGQKIRGRKSKTYVLVGDGECHEGTIWEAALAGQNLKLSNLCCIVDYNGSAAQILPHPSIMEQWRAFGWNTIEIDGHHEGEIDEALSKFIHSNKEKPFAIIAHTTKGKGVSFLESHGPWHHKIPNPQEFEAIMKELT